jgi:ubiquinone/menaquinone biosynthesis C-methylase UbiE
MTLTNSAQLFQTIQALYQKQLEIAPTAYLRAHASPNSIHRHVGVFLRYLPFVQECRRILDWGCFHAVDSCLLRTCLGDQAELHGCDYNDPEPVRTFHQYAGLEYHRLENGIRLPYADASFEAVIGSGVLEHVAMVGESLKELHRILANNGVLVITFLPNARSYTEFLARRMKVNYHHRRYSPRQIEQLLLHYGFEPVMIAYHQFIPAQKMQGVFKYLWRFNAALEKLPPFKWFSANLMVVAIRRTSMSS